MDRTLFLEPVDAWFFRDGRPYEKEESNQMDVESAFPPSPPTVVGAIRAALAREHGWPGVGRWNKDLEQVLGDGFQELGQISFSGPWLARTQGSSDPELLFPAPLYLLGESDHNSQGTGWKPVALLVPGNRFPCDLGDVRLPVRDREVPSGTKPASGFWITAEGLSGALRGKLPEPDQFTESRCLWQHEYRVALHRDETSRTTGEDALYSPSYVRLCRGVSVATRVSGVPDDWKIPATFPLGGESRLASCRSSSRPVSLPEAPAERIRETGRFVVTLLTPLRLPPRNEITSPPRAGEEFPGLPGTSIVSACVDRPERLGGWNSLTRQPLPLLPCFPAGSTWFCVVQPKAADKVLGQHGRKVGMDTAYGFGQIVLGTWDEEGDSA